MTLNNRVYDRLKFVALVLLPAIAASYFSLEQIWGLPNAEKVVGTITVIDTLLGVVLRASTSSYKKAGGTSDGMTDGDLVIQQADGQQFMGLAVNKASFESIPGKETVTLRVVDSTGRGGASGGS